MKTFIVATVDADFSDIDKLLHIEADRYVHNNSAGTIQFEVQVEAQVSEGVKLAYELAGADPTKYTTKAEIVRVAGLTILEKPAAE